MVTTEASVAQKVIEKSELKAYMLRQEQELQSLGQKVPETELEIM